MRFKGTVVLLVIAILFGGYIYFYEYKGGEEREAAKKIENRLWQFDAEDIVRINLTARDRQMTAERGNNGQWRITSPHEWLADNDQLNRLASSASRLDRESVIESAAADLAQFGLSPAKLELRLFSGDGKEYGIAFGANNPSGNSTYSALTGGNEVFFVSADAALAFNVEAEDLRNRSVISFERTGVQGVILRNHRGIIELEKDNDDRWWFTGTDKREAGGPAVREMLNALHMGKVAEFFDENAEDYVNTSLDKPMIDIVLALGADKGLKRLVVGTEKSELRKKASGAATKNNGDSQKIFLARDDSRKELFFIENDLVKKLSLSANDLRDKALVPFQRWDIDAIILENARGKFQFVKAEGDWFLDGQSKNIDGQSKNKVDWSEINNIFDLLEMPVITWIDNPASNTDYGVESPTTRVVLKKGNVVIAECTFGKSAANGVYAKISGDSSIKIASPEVSEFLSGILHQ